MGKADDSKATNAGTNQGHALVAAIKFFVEIEGAFGTEAAQWAFKEVASPKFQRAMRGVRLLKFVCEQRRAGKGKQDIVDQLTYRTAMGLELDATTRRFLVASRARMLRGYGIAPATAERPRSIRAHIDKLLDDLEAHPDSCSFAANDRKRGR